MTDKLTYPRKTALESPQTLATVIHAIILDQYGEQAYDWDPVTVSMELKDDFGADICEPAMDRWCAIQTVMGSDAFFKRLDVFMNVCNTLASGSPSFLTFDPVTSEEAAWAVAEVAMNRDILPFSYTIQQYMRQQLTADGFDPSSGDLPPVFAEMFERNPDEGRIRSAVSGELGDINEQNIARYLMEQLFDMDVQFNRIPDLKRIDEMLHDADTDVGEAVSENRDAAVKNDIAENTK